MTEQITKAYIRKKETTTNSSLLPPLKNNPQTFLTDINGNIQLCLGSSVMGKSG